MTHDRNTPTRDHPDPRAATRPPLVVTADPALREELQRLAAAAGVTPQVAADPAAALRTWTRAPVVLVGGDLAAELADLAPERRDGVHVLSWGTTHHDLFRAALAIGAENVAELPRSEGWVVEILTDLGEVGRPRGLVVGVVGGSGGAGATTLACALAQIAGRSGDAVVVDCDPLGPGADRILGLDRHPGFRWDALCQTTGRLSARALREALPRREGVGVLSWYAGSPASLQAFAVREALSACRRGHETVVVDLPRSGDPVVAEVVARCDVVLVVTVPTVAGVAAASRVCAQHRGRAPVGLVLHGRPVDTREVTASAGVPVLSAMPHQRGLGESVDLGLGPVRSVRSPLGRWCTELLARLADPGAAPVVPADDPGRAA